MAHHEMNDSEDRKDMNPLEKLRETFLDEVNELIKLELDVEEFTERKAGLLNAYLKDDMHGAKEFWLDLKAEVHTLEEFIGEWLLKAANPTSLDWMKIKPYIETTEDQYAVGEKVSDLELMCIGCGKTQSIEKETRLTACDQCGCELFRAS